MKRSKLKAGMACVSTAVTAFNLLGVAPAFAQTTSAGEPTLTLATSTGTTGAGNARAPSGQTTLTLQAKIALLHQKVKYVFVLFQENRSFDHYFGTYPGANGLFQTYPGALSSDPYAQPGSALSSYNSVIRNTDGSFSTLSPFLIPRTIQNSAGATVQLYPEDTYSVDHSHTGYVRDFHADQATKTTPKNDGYALDQEGLHYATDASGTTATIYNASNVAVTATSGANPSLATKQKGEVVMSHIDCDTIPFLWQYADQFVLFDNMHQTATGPSTPNAIAMIAGQVGDTQWVKHPSEADPTGLSLPNLTDTPPYSGSSSDTAAVQPPYGPDESSNVTTTTIGTPKAGQIPLTFATLPLSFMGNQIGTIVRADQHESTDIADVIHDIPQIAAKDPFVNWAWYQQGYGPEPFDGQAAVPENGGSYNFMPAPQHASYVVHHNGPQYFGYLGDNTKELANLKGLSQFYKDVSNQALGSGGVFYVRGGYYNQSSLKPADPNSAVQAATPGNDDHPNYSDAQLSEALVADSVNAIANSPYWSQSAIIITYDETDGLYDHQPEQFRTYGPDGQPETGGPRIPMIVVSPFAAAHTVSHQYSEHSSVIKFIDEVFGLIPLANLPDEASARAAGAASSAFNAPNGAAQANLGPADALATMGDLTEAFDNDRLMGNVAPLPAPTISASLVDTQASLPHYGGQGCTTLKIVPNDYPNGVYTVGNETDKPPADFNPRPTQSPGNPFLNTGGGTACPAGSPNAGSTTLWCN